jgi:hypothetical protein
MCDYSLQAIKSRPAQVGDKLVAHSFGTGTVGFADQTTPNQDTAVCLIPGTEIAIDPALVLRDGGWFDQLAASVLGTSDELKSGPHSVAIFRQTDKNLPYTHHDALEFPDGKKILVTRLPLGLKATVLQLPAAPRNEVEAQEQKRAEYVG